MVQASEESMGHPNIPQALILLKEMNTSTQHVALLVDNMLQRVRKGELSTNQGLSFLEMKYHTLLSYLINLTYIVLRKCSGENIEGDPCIDRLIELRTVLEKIRPINHKLKYQIDKLVKTAVSGKQADDATVFKANPKNLMKTSSDSSSGEESDSLEDEIKDQQKSNLYTPPKLSAVYFKDGTSAERSKRAQERNKKLMLTPSVMEELREEYLDTPIEITQNSRAQQIISKQEKERREYEEEYLTRLPVTKAEKQLRRKLTTLGTLGNELTDFSTPKKNTKKRKLPLSTKAKKNFKKKRFH